MVIAVAELLLIIAVPPPTVTEVALDRLVPTMVTEVPPAVVPEVGESKVYVGAGTTYVNALPAVTEPPAVVITTSLAPALPDGVVMVIAVAVLLEMVAVLPPTVTEVALERLVPVIVTEVPPAVVPEVGESKVYVGAGTV